MVNLLHVGVVFAEGAVLVFNLDGDDWSAIGDLEGREFLAEALEPAVNRVHEFGIGAADDDVVVFEEPGGIAAPLPLGADVGAGAEDDVEAFTLRFADEFGDVVLAGEVVYAGAGFVDVPEDVGGDGIEAHRLGHAQADTPVGAGNARVVHFAGDDLGGLAVEEELAVFYAEGVGRWRLCGLCYASKREEAREDEGWK